MAPSNTVLNPASSSGEYATYRSSHELGRKVAIDFQCAQPQSDRDDQGETHAQIANDSCVIVSADASARTGVRASGADSMISRHACFNASRWPARFPLSTVEIYAG